MANVAPATTILAALHRQPLKWPKVLGELIDNSLDANAKQVIIRFQPRSTLTVSDDGAGCDNPESMLILGDHHHQGTTKLGRFGVGLKDATIWMWGSLRIETTAKNLFHRVSVNWQEVERQGTWEIHDPVTIPARGTHGTTLTFEKIVRPLPTDYQRIVDELSYTFTPGLLQGVQLRFECPKRKPLLATPYVWPTLSEAIEDEFEVNGRGVKLHVGIVKEGVENRKPGFAYCHHHRIIIGSSALGAEGFSTRRICGRVMLDDRWALSVHKDDIDELQDELAAAVRERCFDILKKADSQAMSVASAAFDRKLNESLHAALSGMKKDKKASRDEGESTGTVVPKDTGVTHKRANKKQPGDKMLSDAQLGRVKIDWKPCNGGFGEVDGPGATIWLNESSDYLSRLRTEQNLDALLMLSFGLYINEAINAKKVQKWLPGFNADTNGMEFSTIWAKSLSGVSLESK